MDKQKSIAKMGEQLSSPIPKPWMAVAMRGTIGGQAVVKGESAGFDGSFSADSMEGFSKIWQIVSVIRDRQR